MTPKNMVVELQKRCFLECRKQKVTNIETMHKILALMTVLLILSLVNTLVREIIILFVR